MNIAIIDYSIGNTKSIANALESFGCKTTFTNSESDLAKADGLILSGVGNFDEGIQNLRRMGLDKKLSKLVRSEKKPILGICLGLQLMTLGSDESNFPGLGWLNCRTEKLSKSDNTKIPNIGWNTVEIGINDRLTQDMTSESRLYFTHSYAILDAPRDDVTIWSRHGERFVAAIRSDNIYGVQFHPEKSYEAGYTLLRNFVELACEKD
jgi:glutamine amidotransferase